MAKKDEVKEIVKAAEPAKVVLVDAKEGFHSVFCKAGMIEFVNGEAVVSAEAAAELKEIGLIK